MSASQKHDPLSAISEADATGETAAIFADIRATMRLPMVTSIWRILAGVDGGLPAAWQATKPIFISGYPDLLLEKLREQVHLPIPQQDNQTLNLSEKDLAAIRNIIDAYTRSNSLNLLALTGLVVEPSGKLPDRQPAKASISIPHLPTLLEKNEIDPSTWQLLLALNEFGASPDEPGLATLWRHLAYWPDLLSVIFDVLHPLQKNGLITQSIQNVLETADKEGRRLATLRPTAIQEPETAYRMIKKYVTHPGLVARMVAIGNGLSIWLQPDSHKIHG